MTDGVFMCRVSLLCNSIRWILLGTFTTTGRPWGGQHIALGLPTATERRWWAVSSTSLKSSAIQTLLHLFFLSADCNPLLQSADQRHLLPERRMRKPAAQWPRQLWGSPTTPPIRNHVILKTCISWRHDVTWVFSPLEICGAGSPGWGVHDVETGGVSVWGGSRHPALPPHRAHL